MDEVLVKREKEGEKARKRREKGGGVLYCAYCLLEFGTPESRPVCMTTGLVVPDAAKWSPRASWQGMR